MVMADLKAFTAQLTEKDREIRKSKEEWESTFDAVVELIILLDTNYIIKRCNEAFLNFFDSDEIDVIGQPCYEFIHSDTGGPIENCPYNKSMASLEPCSLTAHLHDHYLEITCTPIIDKRGEVLGIVHVMHDITELKNLNNELTESNISLSSHTEELTNTEQELRKRITDLEYQSQLIRSMCDNVPDMIWAKDLNKQFIFANKAISERLLNAIDTSEPIGKDDMFFANRERQTHPGNYVWHTFGEKYIDSDDAVLKSLKPQKFNEYGNASGQYLELDVYKAPFYFNDELIGVVGCGRDITYEKQLKEEIKSKINFIDSLTQSLPVPIAYLTLDATYIDCNEAFAHFYGIKREKIIGKTRADLFPEEVAYFNELDRKLITGDGECPQRIFHTMYDNYYLPHSVMLIRSLHYDSDGSPIGIIVVSVGIPHTSLPDIYKTIGGV